MIEMLNCRPGTDQNELLRPGSGLSQNDFLRPGPDGLYFSVIFMSLNSDGNFCFCPAL